MPGRVTESVIFQNGGGVSDHHAVWDSTLNRRFCPQGFQLTLHYRSINWLCCIDGGSYNPSIGNAVSKASTGERKQQLGQALRLLGWLSEPGPGFTACELADRLGVHKRTITRTITALGDAGFVIHDERCEGGKRYRADEGVSGAFLSPAPEEMAALSVAVGGLRRDGSPHAAQLENLQTKLGLALRRQARVRLEADMDPLVRRQRIAPSPGPLVDNDPQILTLIQSAIKAGTCIEIDYQRSADVPAKRRLVEPWGLLLGRVCYLVARDAGTETELYNFRVDRIMAARTSTVMAEVPEEWTLDERLAQSVGVFTGDAHDIVLRVRPHGVAEARQWRFHPAQVLVETGEELLIRFHAGGLRELAEHLFGWGDKILVEAPEALRAEMRERLRLVQATL